MNKYILIDSDNVVQGFFPSVEEAKQYARQLDLQGIAIYELVDNSYNLAEEGVRYEVIRQDHSKTDRKFYIYDNKAGCTVDDAFGCTLYYDTLAEAQAECDELNA